jgi:hypothetical protein
VTSNWGSEWLRSALARNLLVSLLPTSP